MQVTKDLVIKGIHAKFMDELQSESKYFGMGPKNPLFIDIYLTCGVLGLVNDLTDVEDTANDDIKSCTIPRNVLQNRMHDIDFLYQLAALNKYLEVDEEKAIQVAFQTGDIEHRSLDRHKIFHGHALAGMRYVYDKCIVKNENGEEILFILDELRRENTSIEELNSETADQILDNYFL